jgi:hypothetical protein
VKLSTSRKKQMNKIGGWAVVLFLGLATTVPAHAEDVDYDKEPVVDWKAEKNPLQGFLSQCTSFDDKWGQPVCRYEEEGFKSHYKQQKNAVKPLKRDRATPRAYCGMVVQNLLDNQFPNGGAFFTNEKVRAAFKANVKTVTCKYDGDAKQSPSFALNGSDFVIRVRFSGDSDYPSKLLIREYSAWYKKDLAKVFPEFKREWNAAHGPHDQL